MYNKIFTKILDSSIWLESDATRIVWVTLIAAMDEDGFCSFASVANLAHRAHVSRDAGEAAVKVLESPDPDSSDPDHEGRRIERVAGGWIVLNSEKYRDLVTRAIAREKTRNRVARHRASKRTTPPINDDVPSVTPCNASVTPSEAVTKAVARAETEAVLARLAKEFCDLYPKRIETLSTQQEFLATALRISNRFASQEDAASWLVERVRTYASCAGVKSTELRFLPSGTNWLKKSRYDDDDAAWGVTGSGAPYSAERAQTERILT